MRGVYLTLQHDVLCRLDTARCARAEAALAPASLPSRSSIVAACSELCELSLLVRREAAVVAQVPVALTRFTRADVSRDVGFTGADSESKVLVA